MIQLGRYYKEEPSSVRQLRYAFWNLTFEQCSAFSVEMLGDPHGECSVALWRRVVDEPAQNAELYRGYVRLSEQASLHLEDYELVVNTFLEALFPSLQNPPPEIPIGVDLATTVAVSDEILILNIRRETDRLFVSAPLTDEDMGRLAIPLEFNVPDGDVASSHGKRAWWRFWR